MIAFATTLTAHTMIVPSTASQKLSIVKSPTSSAVSRARVGDPRHAGVRDEDDRAPGRGLRREGGRAALLRVLVADDELRRGDAERGQQRTGAPRVLTGDHVRPAQRLPARAR